MTFARILLAYRGGMTNLRDHLFAKLPLFYSPSSNNTTTKTSATQKRHRAHFLFKI
uniref:Uncharacterized protein n=1 Tax=Amphimedon queenslandica TaxID=400682 RepID=A0A1X7VT13_AMPQE